MSLDVFFLTLLFLVVLYMMIIEVFTVVLMLTGMSNTRARFQVISMLTSTGFTTSESEIIVSSRKRRKIAITIMLFSTIFNVAVVSILVNVIMTVSKSHTINVLHISVYLLIFLGFLILVKKIPSFRVGFDNIVKRIATKISNSKNANPMLILDNFHGYCIVQIKIVDVPTRLRGKTIIESGISKDFGVRVLNIKRCDKYIGDVEKDERIIVDDRVMVYGPLENIIEVFEQKPSFT